MPSARQLCFSFLCLSALNGCAFEPTIQTGSAEILGDAMTVKVSVRRPCSKLRLDVASMSLSNPDAQKIEVHARCSRGQGDGPNAALDLGRYRQAILDGAAWPPRGPRFRVRIVLREDEFEPPFDEVFYEFWPDCSDQLRELVAPEGIEVKRERPDCGYFWRYDGCALRRGAVLDCIRHAFDGETYSAYAVEFSDHAFTEHIVFPGSIQSRVHAWDGSETHEISTSEWRWPP